MQTRFSRSAFVPTTTTLDISWKVQTDSFTVSGTDTTWFAEEDETYSYNITVRNTGTLTATNILLRDVLPDSVINWRYAEALRSAIWHHQRVRRFRSITVVSDLPLYTVPVGEHDHRDGRQRRSANPNVYRHSFRDRKAVCPDHHDAGYFVESADQQLHGEWNNGASTWFAEEDETYSYNITVGIRAR
ncbi:MAG: hypothetical protein R3C26_07030 [Calditrichia bacterium]